MCYFKPERNGTMFTTDNSFNIYRPMNSRVIYNVEKNQQYIFLSRHSTRVQAYKRLLGI